MAERGVRGWVGKQYDVGRHGLATALGSGRLGWRIFFVLAELWVIGNGMVLANPKVGLSYLGVVGLLRIVGRVWKFSAPANIQSIELSSRARSFELYALNQALARWPEMSINEIKTFQNRVLKLVASYARDYRGDLKAKVIFANLLEERGEEMEVVARSENHRPLYTRFPKEHSLAWRAMKAGEAQTTGSLYDDFPLTVTNKKYRSILGIPVLDPSDRVVGVVTIDSTETHHFESIRDDLSVLVMHLVGMLGWSIWRLKQMKGEKPESVQSNAETGNKEVTLEPSHQQAKENAS